MLSKVIAQANIDHAEKWFERADKIVIVTHVSPDGDAIGFSEMDAGSQGYNPVR